MSEDSWNKQLVPLWQAFVKAQGEMDSVKKDSKNPHFKSNYASLGAVIDAVIPIANKHGLAVTQHINVAESGFVRVVTKVTHADSGHSIQDDQVLPVSKLDAQGYVAAVTYARRAGIKAMFCLAEEDDDGNTAVAKPETAKPAPKVEKKSDPITEQQNKEVQDKLSKAIGWTAPSEKKW